MTDERAGEVMRELDDLADGGALTDHDADLLRDAANEIERLRAALKPFARIASDWRLKATESVVISATLITHAAEVLK